MRSACYRTPRWTEHGFSCRAAVQRAHESYTGATINEALKSPAGNMFPEGVTIPCECNQN